MIWGYGRDYNESDIRQAFEVSLEAGVNFFDTAETYAQGRSERYLGKFMAESGNIAVTATKFMPFPWRLSKSALPRALRDSLERLDMQQVDLYQLHWPLPPVSIETWADALADVVEAGLARAVGVSNYNEAQMRRAYSALARRGVPLASNQAPYHLLNRKLEFDGTLATCRELGITLIAYSPLAQGALTGKYTPQKPLPGLRGRRVTRAALENIQPLIRQMREIGRAHDGKTPAQVALNWLICKGAVPIPGAKNARQAQENASALGWSLSEGEVAVLDEISAGLA
ncbi:MAG: aldo/keto reductase [Anaerolineales bacterium]|nr:aldo/keto reductase [Anaerolineales bacterium]